MANALSERGHQVTALCNDENSGRPFYHLSKNVDFVNINGSGKTHWEDIKFPPLFKFAREVFAPFKKTFLGKYLPNPMEVIRYSCSHASLMAAISKASPDVIVCFFLNAVYALSFSKSLDIPIVFSHRSEPGLLQESPDSHLHSLDRCQYIHLLNPGFVCYMRKKHPRSRTIVIPNAIDQYNEKEIVKPVSKDSYRIIMTGRLCEVPKQQHFLIKAFSRIAVGHANWELLIYGDAPTGNNYTNELKKLISTLKLENRVHLMGRTNDPICALKKCDVFAFPSQYEGFPRSLSEAMSVGLPSVGLKTASGVNELIVDGQNGLLSANNERDFAKKLATLMDDIELRKRLGRNAYESMKQYAPEIVWDQWERLLEEVSGKSGSPGCVQENPEKRNAT